MLDFYSSLPFESVLGYASAVFIISLVPGPATLTVISVGIRRWSGSAFVVGIGAALGDSLLVGFAMLGLAALVHTHVWLLQLVKYLGFGYLLWLGFKMWITEESIEQAKNRKLDRWHRLLWSGIIVSVSNPKAILFHSSMLPQIFDLPRLRVLDVSLVMIVIAVVNIITMGFYAAICGPASRWFQAPRHIRAMNRVTSVILFGAASAIVLSK